MLKEKLDDLSRQSICEQLNISRATLNNWEKYKTHNVFKYIKLCKMLNIDPFNELEKYERKQTLEDKNNEEIIIPDNL